MAVGDTLLVFDPLAGQPPTSDSALLALESNLAVLKFSDGATSSMQFLAPLPSHYRGGTLVAALTHAADATMGQVRIRFDWTRLADGMVFDPLPTTSATTDETLAVPAVANELSRNELAAATVAGVAAGDLLLVTLERLGTDAADTLAADWQLLSLEIKEA